MKSLADYERTVHIEVRLYTPKWTSATSICAWLAQSIKERRCVKYCHVGIVYEGLEYAVYFGGPVMTTPEDTATGKYKPVILEVNSDAFTKSLEVTLLYGQVMTLGTVVDYMLYEDTNELLTCVSFANRVLHTDAFTVDALYRELLEWV